MTYGDIAGWLVFFHLLAVFLLLIWKVLSRRERPRWLALLTRSGILLRSFTGQWQRLKKSQ